MSDKLVILLKQRYAIEQRIHQLNTATIAESKRENAVLMAAKLQDALDHINEGIRSLKRNQSQWKDVKSRTAMDTGRPKAYRQPGERPKADDREESERLMRQFLAKGGKIKKESGGHVDPSGYTQEPDHEVQMARSDLYRAAKHAIMLHEILQNLDERQGLEGWVQAKITKASDYIETVWHYLSYEMKFPGDEQGYNHHEGVGEATITAFKPGQDPNDPAFGGTGQQAPGQVPGQPPQAPGAPATPPAAGQSSATPSSGGSTPGATADGMVKMSKLGPDRKPLGTPLMVKSTDIMGKQKEGFVVIGEGKDDKVVHCSQCGKGFSGGGLKAPHHTGFSHCKDHKDMKIVAEDASAGASSAGAMGGSPTGFASGGIGMQKRKKKKFSEAGFNPSVSTPTTRAQAASRFGHDPDRAATVYKANKYDPKTGLGGYIAPRGDTTDKSNILLQLKSNLDTATSKPLTFQDGSTLEIRPSIARTVLGKIEVMRPVEKHEIIKNLMTSKDAFIDFVKGQGESKEEETGPKFTGYWKGKDKKTPGKKMVGDA